MHNKVLFTIFSLALFVSACSPAAVSTSQAAMTKPTEVMMAKPTDAMMDKPSATPDAMGKNKMASPAWFGVSLTDVVGGKKFTLNDFKGKVVLVEDLAMWCPTCKMQQIQVKALRESMGMNKDLVAIGLDIDAQENAADLKTYTQNNGFDWIYAVSPAGVSHEISQTYGDQFLNPPSTPVLIIDRKGQVHPMPLGIKSADDLKKFIAPFLAENM